MMSQEGQQICDSSDKRPYRHQEIVFPKVVSIETDNEKHM